MKRRQETFSDAQKSLQHIVGKIDNVDKCNAIDIFARKGDWISHIIYPKVNSFEAWEIDPDYIESLQTNLPNAQVHCRDSIKFIKENTDYKKFDIVFIDNGLNCYGENREYCEHFDVLPHIDNISSDNCFVIINVVTKPFSYDDYPDWKTRRNEFYGVSDSSELSLAFLEVFYEDYFSELGYDVLETHTNCREYKDGVDYNYHFGFKLVKRENNG
tara:strand:- start:75 stop:719 length:645 start_codon:yes stop_codon:yes gene_type:complete